jgi:hypothetical protein
MRFVGKLKSQTEKDKTIGQNGQKPPFYLNFKEKFRQIKKN